MSTEAEISYGEWEINPDQPPTMRTLPDGRTITEPSLRRRRYEKWRDEHGNPMGRWDWVYE